MFIFIVSCSNTNIQNIASTTSPPNISATDLPDKKEDKLIINVSLGIHEVKDDGFESHETRIIDRTPYPHINDWYSLIKESYGLDIEVNYISSMYAPSVISGGYYVDKINSGDISGIVLLEYGYHGALAEMISSGVIVPLNEYIGNNEIFKSFPEEFKNAYKLADGNIWAIPAEYETKMFQRFYRRDWLKALNLSEPENLNELYEITTQFSTNDPDGDGTNNEKGMNAMYHSGAGAFGDIFIAHDCYFSNNFCTPISFDKNSGSYEDCALKPSMTDALEYIKNLIDKNMVALSPDYSFLKSPNTGNFFLRDNKVEDKDTWTTTFSLASDKPAVISLTDRYFAL